MRRIIGIKYFRRALQLATTSHLLPIKGTRLVSASSFLVFIEKGGSEFLRAFSNEYGENLAVLTSFLCDADLFEDESIPTTASAV